MAKPQTAEEFWRKQLTEHSIDRFGRLLFHYLPSDPRCKICYTPFGAPGGLLMRAVGVHVRG